MSPRHLFLDANIYLSFYLYGKDDLEQMEKVIKLIDDEEIILHTNQQLKEEVLRNRSAKIAEGLNPARSQNFFRDFPNYFKDYAEFASLKEKLKEVSQIHSELLKRVSSDVKENRLRADLLIQSLFSKGTNEYLSEVILNQAAQRCDRGNPPGKRGSIGDAVHWEFLLASKAWRIDIVSIDADFSSALEPDTLDEFLAAEWKGDGNLSAIRSAKLFRSISDYFKVNFPNIHLSDEIEKDTVITQLCASGTFKETHELIGRLESYDSFTRAQTRRIFAALLNNEQVSWIAQDSDVKKFYLRFKDHAWYLPYTDLEKASKILQVDEDFFTPF